MTRQQRDVDDMLASAIEDVDRIRIMQRINRPISRATQAEWVNDLLLMLNRLQQAIREERWTRSTQIAEADRLAREFQSARADWRKEVDAP